LDFHGFADAKIAYSKSYPTSANWKLIVENFVECYHCGPASHPEFCSMHPRKPSSLRRGPSSGPAGRGRKILAHRPSLGAAAATLGRPIGTVDDGPTSSHLRLLLQRTIREGYESETQDGRPASSLMGKRLGFDQGRMYLSVQSLHAGVATNDFAVLFVFTPRGPCKPTWTCTVGRRQGHRSRCGEDDLGGDRTTLQDKQITENNQAGILSKRYQPGRYPNTSDGS